MSMKIKHLRYLVIGCSCVFLLAFISARKSAQNSDYYQIIEYEDYSATKSPAFASSTTTETPQPANTRRTGSGRNVANETQGERLTRMWDVCWGTALHAEPLTPVDNLHYLMVDDKRRYLFCIPHKCGSTNWFRMLERIADPKKELNLNDYLFGKEYTERTGIRWMDTYTLQEQTEKIKNYLKIMFVRNPYSRLVSAYRDKFEFKTDMAYVEMEQTMLKIIRGPDYIKSPNANSSMTFQEFIGYILDHQRFDGHWSTYQLQCMPCKVKYHYIGKFESFQNDSSEIVKKITGNDFTLPFIHKRFGPSSEIKTNKLVSQYFSRLPEHMMTRIRAIYSTDLDMFDYDRDP